MSNDLLQVPVIVKEIKSRPNRAAVIRLEAQENLSDEMLAKLAVSTGKFAWCLLAEEQRPIQPEDLLNLPKLEAWDEDGGKSPAARYRGILFRYWESLNKPTATFDEFYRRHYEKMFMAISEKLN